MRGSLFEYVDVVPDKGERVLVKFDSREALGPATASFWGPDGAESALEQNGFRRSWSVHKYGYFAGQGDTKKAMSRQELESRGAVFIPASRMEKLR